MRVLCKYNSGGDLTPNHFDIGYTSESEFDLKKGKEYSVYGITLSKGLLSYLIVGEGLAPHWYPAELFIVTRSELPASWHFAALSEKDGYVVNAIWGYEELVATENHFDDLSNLEPDAMKVFVERKRQIDESL
jgi:hypothetical protein